ncbi:MAG TPA: high-affinity nickel-transport family protein [Candidatus Angelobacter sp.]|jgi:high-affinity nickel-transport protein|nr:high-affinity nickel-transport family protein [Candidatus Angelobacter sp.]
MINLLTVIAISFLLGMKHAVDPDHVIAVSTIVTREHSVKRSALIGVAWGIGHTLTILAVGGSIILFRITLPPRLGLAMEMAVGIMLIWLGVKNLGGVFAWAVRHPALAPGNPGSERPNYHAHGDYVHIHQHPEPHAHPHDPRHNPVAVMDRRFKQYGTYQLLRPLMIGIVHGLAGSAAIALLVLSTIANVRWAITYLLVFGIGTILGMMVITLTIGSTFAFGQKRFRSIGRHLSLAAGLISVAFGIFIAYRIGFVDGLFTSHAHWTPR